MIRAVIFDCFGVIITDALQAISNQLRLSDPKGADEIKRIITLNNRGLMNPAESSPMIAKVLGVSTEEYRSKIEFGEVKDAGVLDYILSLRTQHLTAMLSNIGAESLDNRFSVEELDRHFDVVVASGEIGYAKPEAKAYEIVATRLGVRNDECVFTDDREEYCAAARAVGMRAILYDDLSHFKENLEKMFSQSEK